jgi:hypothetical protein
MSVNLRQHLQRIAESKLPECCTSIRKAWDYNAIIMAKKAAELEMESKNVKVSSRLS